MSLNLGSLRARALVFASLAVFLPQLSPAGEAEPQRHSEGASAPAPLEQLHQRANPAAEALRGLLPDDTVDRHLPTPSLPSPPRALGMATIGASATAEGALEADAGALLVLPSSRAPPARS